MSRHLMRAACAAAGSSSATPFGWQATGTTAAITGSGSSVTRPAAAVGDQLWMIYAGHGSGITQTPPTTPPSGWTLADSTGGAGNWIYTYTKVVGSSEPSSYSGLPQPTTIDHATATILNYGTCNATPVDVHTNSTFAINNRLRFPSVSPTGSADILLLIGFANTGGNLVAVTSPPAGFTARIDNTATQYGIYMCDTQLSASGATGVQNAVHTGGTVNTVGVSIALAP